MGSDDDSDPELRGVEQIVGHLYEACGGDRDELAAALTEYLGDDRDYNATAAAMAGIAMGNDLGDQRELMQRLEGGAVGGGQDVAPEADGPLTTVREIEDDGQFRGLRVLCPDPDADLLLDPQGNARVQSGSQQSTHLISFEIEDVDVVANDSMSEWVIRPADVGPERTTAADMLAADDAGDDDQDEPASDEPTGPGLADLFGRLSGGEPQGERRETDLDDPDSDDSDDPSAPASVQG